MFGSIQKFFAANPLLDNQKEVMYDYKLIMQYIIEDFFSGVCFIDTTSKIESQRLQFKNFRYKGDIKSLNVLGEFPDKIAQKVYQNGLSHIKIDNVETRYKLKEIIEVSMSLIVQI